LSNKEHAKKFVTEIEPLLKSELVRFNAVAKSNLETNQERGDFAMIFAMNLVLNTLSYADPEVRIGIKEAFAEHLDIALADLDRMKEEGLDKSGNIRTL
jgi:hypothetical protein